MAVELSASFWHFLHTFIEKFWARGVKQISRDLVGSCHRRDAVCLAPQVDFYTSRFYNNIRRAFYIFLALSAHMHIRHHTCIMHRKMQNDAIYRNVLEKELPMNEKNINTPPPPGLLGVILHMIYLHCCISSQTTQTNQQNQVPAKQTRTIGVQTNSKLIDFLNFLCIMAFVWYVCKDEPCWPNGGYKLYLMVDMGEREYWFEQPVGKEDHKFRFRWQVQVDTILTNDRCQTQLPMKPKLLINGRYACRMNDDNVKVSNDNKNVNNRDWNSKNIQSSCRCR